MTFFSAQLSCIICSVTAYFLFRYNFRSVFFKLKRIRDASKQFLVFFDFLRSGFRPIFFSASCRAIYLLSGFATV